MRELKQSDTNKLVIKDGLSGGEITFYYRTPTTRERVSYQNRLVTRKGGKIRYNLAETRLEGGLAILTGFEYGDVGFDGKPIATDPAHPDYRPDWKDLMKETASDLVTILAFTVFEGAKVDGAGEGIDFEEEEEEDLPFGTSSGG